MEGTSNFQSDGQEINTHQVNLANNYRVSTFASVNVASGVLAFFNSFVRFLLGLLTIKMVPLKYGT